MLSLSTSVNKAQYRKYTLDLRGLVHRSPLNIMVKLLHEGKPLLQYGCGVVRVVIRGGPEEREERAQVKETIGYVPVISLLV